MPSMNNLEFTVIVCVQLVLICVHLYSLPVMCQESYGGVRQRRTAQGSGRAATCECGSESATLTCSDEPTDCDDGEVSHGGSCYRIIRDDLKSRDDAHRDCIARNSHLVYIESEEEQTFLSNHSESLVGNGSRKNDDVMNHYWIGLIPTSSNVWLDGNQTRNDLFEYSDGSAAGCFSLSKSNGNLRLSGENCDVDRQFICEFPYTCTSPLEQYFNHDGSCYWVGGPMKSHLSARGDCSDKGGHLLYIESQDELRFINSSVISEDGVGYWIGLATQYAWLDGSRAIYQGIVQTDASNNGGSLCFRLRAENDFLWNDIGCNTNYAYICERELPVISSQEIQENPEVPCRPPVADLSRLLDSVPLCVRSDSHYFNNSVLCQCDDDETCISGCGCARDNTMAG
ncbi:macrophage mannose receptor 1-like [Patiria miniata]|uniref:C-type lectin domain-containing protein n=1 Tax=Patiria miniata TaxID=46514 RepID=A0A914A3Y3_PATMI|nr:macrophage mannose receptor 1-like [Patiria miniata]